jgi:hypothetical protein
MGALKLLQIIGGGLIERIVDRPLDIIQQQLNFRNQQKNLQNEQQLRHEESRFQQELALENRKRNAEIDAFISDEEIKRQSKIAETLANYQRTMAECSVSIGKSLGAMDIELREKATALVMQRHVEYKQLQESATEKAMAQLENISKKFPEGSTANEMMTASVINQLNNIVETSNNFMRTIDADFEKMMDSIRRITESTMLNANQYISPNFAKNISGANDTKLIQ